MHAYMLRGLQVAMDSTGTAGDGAFHKGIHSYGAGSGYGAGVTTGGGFVYGDISRGCGVNYGYYGYGGGR